MYQLSPRVSIACFPGEVLMIDFRSGNYYHLNQLAGSLIKLIGEQGLSASWLELLKLEKSSLAQKIVDFIPLLLSENLITEAISFPLNTSSVPDELFQMQPEECFLLRKFDDLPQLLKLDEIYNVDSKGWPVHHG